MDDYDLGEDLGKGLCGGVVVATRKRDKHKVFFFFSINIISLVFFSPYSPPAPPPPTDQVALKLIDMNRLIDTFSSYSVSLEQLQANVNQEIEILHRLNHKNIVQLEDHFCLPPRIFLCLELVVGDDLLAIIPKEGLPEEQAKKLFYQISSAVAYCHANNVIFLFF